MSKKLYISLFSLLLLIVVAGTVTFAWFKLNTNAWFDDMELEVNSANGVKISIDGKNYKNQLSAKEIKVAILAKANGYGIGYIDKEPCYTFKNASGTTEYLDADNYEEEFAQKMSLEPVTSTDGENFKNLFNQVKTVRDTEFINLDLYFMADDASDRRVYFSSRELVYNGEYVPKTELTVKNADSIGFPNRLAGSFDTYNPLTGELFRYDKSEDNQPDFEFKTLASDAIRFSTCITNNGVRDNNYKIYEIGTGVGSYATDLTEDYYVGPIGARYDFNKNAGFSYYNNVRGYETGQVLNEISYSSIPQTYKGFDTLEGATILDLNKENNYGQNGTAKMNIFLWIEGWDADCMDSIWNQTIQMKMAFTSFEIQTEPVELTYMITNPETGEVVNSGFKVYDEEQGVYINSGTKVVHQIQGQKISEQSPIKDIYSINGIHKFKGWGKLDANGEITPWNFDEEVWARSDNPEDLKWTFVTIWE
ncbi:MAG: hypothetical protein ACI35W_07170 [Anaeroplasmataceae bacterium]